MSHIQTGQTRFRETQQAMRKSVTSEWNRGIAEEAALRERRSASVRRRLVQHTGSTMKLQKSMETLRV